MSTMTDDAKIDVSINSTPNKESNHLDKVTRGNWEAVSINSTPNKESNRKSEMAIFQAAFGFH